jgi:hypothetical protein
MADWLLNRLFAAGDQPTPRFAVQSTLNWMRALTILVSSKDFSPEELEAFYSSVVRRHSNEEADTRAFESLLMALHNVSALNAMQSVGHPYDVVRTAIVAWYYTIYESASAMTLAASGATAEQHAKTSRIWHSDIVQMGYAVGPFGLHLNTLVEKDVKLLVKTLRNGSSFLLVDSPNTYEQAWGAACAYVGGTADYEKWKVEERVRASSEFKSLSVDSFRTNAARDLRDKKLASGQVNFLDQAFRYRGKANYRDSIYLSYGANRTDAIAQFLNDLFIVSCAFLKMAQHYVSRRVEASSWRHFVADLDINCRIQIAPDLISKVTKI